MRRSPTYLNRLNLGPIIFQTHLIVFFENGINCKIQPIEMSVGIQRLVDFIFIFIEFTKFPRYASEEKKKL